MQRLDDIHEVAIVILDHGSHHWLWRLLWRLRGPPGRLRAFGLYLWARGSSRGSQGRGAGRQAGGQIGLGPLLRFRHPGLEPFELNLEARGAGAKAHLDGGKRVGAAEIIHVVVDQIAPAPDPNASAIAEAFRENASAVRYLAALAYRTFRGWGGSFDEISHFGAAVPVPCRVCYSLQDTPKLRRLKYRHYSDMLAHSL